MNTINYTITESHAEARDKVLAERAEQVKIFIGSSQRTSAGRNHAKHLYLKDEAMCGKQYADGCLDSYMADISEVTCDKCLKRHKLNKSLAEREAEHRFRHYFCDGCGKQDTFANPQEASLFGWTFGEGCEFCLGCSY